MSDWIKLPAILAAYFVVAPVAGLLLARRRQAQRWALALLVLMTSWHINKLTLMFLSVETYRGHTKGFEGSLLQIVALALLVARAVERAKDFRLMPRGAGWWLLHCGLAAASIPWAANSVYGAMAAWKFASAVVIFAAAWNHVREQEDVRWLLRAVAATLVVQALVVLKMKYADGYYQVRGWFEHQNPLAMWAQLLGLPMLAGALAASTRLEARWRLAGYIAAGIMVQAALSRAALMLFALGSVAVALWSLAEGVTLRKMRILAVLGFVAAVGLLATIGTIIARFHDEGNHASGETRGVLNQASALMLADHPLGVGWNNYGIAINPPYPYGEPVDQWTRDRGHRVNEEEPKGISESHYWLLLAENGYLGAGSFGLFAVLTGYWAWRGQRQWRGTEAGALLLGLVVALVLAYAHGTLERVLTQTKNLATWLLLLGVAARWGARSGRGK
jgi:hypothetical protein